MAVWGAEGEVGRSEPCRPGWTTAGTLPHSWLSVLEKGVQGPRGVSEMSLGSPWSGQ